ncbi:MAG: glycosyltransferase family 25 protein [Gammaproteobacteria bacterium]|nr:glycosyltransferase family 25 protein [Gammaproteobacteria bacterium]
MKIKVISLSSSIRHRESVRRQLLSAGASFEFCNAITARDALRHIHHYDEQEFLLNCGRPAAEKEIACYASHLALWQQCAQGDGPYLILEDDAELDESFLAGLLVVASRIQEHGLICVAPPQLDDSLALEDFGHFEIRYCRRASRVALAYAISPTAAARLARAGKVVEEPVGSYMQRFWRHGQPVYSMCPPIVRLSPAAKESSLGGHGRGKRNFSTSLKRAVRNCQDAIARVRFNYFVSHGSI